MILLLDLNDSFVFTLAGYLAQLGQEARVMRAARTSLEEIRALKPGGIVLSPGPDAPAQAPLALEVIRQLGGRIPILGVCLGHQCIAAAYGARVERSAHPRHGMASLITHDGRGIFRDLPSPLLGARYHSLAVVPASVPPDLEITALADDGEVMGVRHRRFPVEGVQFHPESILTEHGLRMMGNFVGVGAGGGSRWSVGA